MTTLKKVTTNNNQIQLINIQFQWYNNSKYEWAWRPKQGYICIGIGHFELFINWRFDTDGT